MGKGSILRDRPLCSFWAFQIPLSQLYAQLRTWGGILMSDDLAALLLTLATENAELRQQLAEAQDNLVETAIDAGHLHARIEAVQVERDAWRVEAERLGARPRAAG